MRRREFIAGLGGVAVWPLAARAQQPALREIGYLSGGLADTSAGTLAAFRKGLREQGYAEERDIEILYRWAETQYDQLPAMATDLVRHDVAVIVTTNGNAAALAAKSATKTIPIVFQIGGDPVELGLVASLNRPGSNVTGVTFLAQELTIKRLELLRETVPTALPIGFLINSTDPGWEARMKAVETAARRLGVGLVIQKASTPSEIEAAYAIFVGQRIGAVLVDADPLFFAQREQLVALAARHAVPAIYHVREIVEAGGLMSYGAKVSDAYRLAGSYAGRILKGEKPADLPVQQSTRIETVVNLRAAKALGLEVPTATLLRADEVIE
jgi:putative ABC transport system substrate-binding protein